MEFDGLTGPISFKAENHHRSDFKLDFLKLKEDRLEKVGVWTPAGGLAVDDVYAFQQGRPPNITLKVLSRVEQPFVMVKKAKEDGTVYHGNDRFEVIKRHFLC